MNRLLQWNPSGFSVYAEQLVWDDEPQRLEKLAATSPALPFELTGVSQTQDSRVLLTTPPHPLTGETLLFLDPLDWVHAICQQLPKSALRRRVTRRSIKPIQLTADPASAGAPASRACWARLIRKVFEVDPLICARCGGEMKVIAVVPQFEGAQGRGQNRSTPSGKGRIRRAPPGAAPQIPPELRGVCSSALAKLA